jgi:CheY-like chemotaxis protein
VCALVSVAKTDNVSRAPSFILKRRLQNVTIWLAPSGWFSREKSDAAGIGVCREAIIMGQQPRVLLVSYVEDERIMYGATFRAAGLDTQACADPAAAIDALSWRPDVVVTRILQPGAPFDGLELVRRIRRNPAARRALIIGLTSFVRTFQANTVKDSKLDALFLLPCDPYQLLAHIKTALACRSKPARHRLST